MRILLFHILLIIYDNLINLKMDCQQQKKVVLIGDIGGTNSRLSLVRMTDVKKIVETRN
jgi:hypothetical protein